MTCERRNELKDENNPVILVYRRTHKGDPNSDGIFGCHGCMKSVRDWDYQAVIGIGGTKPDSGHEGIKERITWIGIGPKKAEPTNEDFDYGGNLITFDNFLLLDENGPKVNKDNFANLYNYMFVNRKIPRAGKYFEDKVIYPELKKILKLAEGAPPSPARNISPQSKSTGSKCASTNATRTSRGCA
jgi:hypothetical protein